MTNCTEHPSFQIIDLEETDSTNRYLSDLCDNTPTAPIEYTTVTARFQTSGKGQRGNSWESEAGQNLLFSTVLYPRFVEARRQFVLSQIVSLAVKEELDTYTEGISIKWPNDIYWEDRKIAGILIENVLSGSTFARSIVGIGLNLNQEVFVSDAPNPVSLFQITGHTCDIEEVLDQFADAFRTRYRQTFDIGSVQALREEYAATLYRNDGVYPYCSEDETFYASITGVEPDGHLILTTDTGEERRFAFKEVSFLL